MKFKNPFIALFITINCLTVFSQDRKPTVAVANPNINGLSTPTESVAKMMRLEFIKLDKFIVLDST